MTRARSILVIEDTEDFRIIINHVLTQKGYNVYLAKHGQQAFEILSQLPRIDAILLDLMMPIMDGWTFLKRREHNAKIKNTPVIVISACGETQPKGNRVNFLAKPINFSILLATLQNELAA